MEQGLIERIDAVYADIAQAAQLAGREASEITLCAASKVQDDDTIRAAISAGVTLCGENRVQELVSHLETDAYAGAEVHFIGHLQTNKVRQVVGKVSLIHSVDSVKLMEAIASQATKLGICQDILVQVNLVEEESKGGIAPAELLALCQLADKLDGVRLRGLMAIPPIATVKGQNAEYFAKIHQLYIDIRDKMAHNQDSINCLSMGMSGDYYDAIAHGATIVRVGTAIFGPRPVKAFA